MGLIKNYFNNTCKPVGIMGKLMVNGMDVGHSKVSDWGLSHLPAVTPSTIADLGCGGGKTAAKLMKRFPNARLTAIDYSDISIEKATKRNQKEIRSGQCTVVKGDVSALPIPDESFDLITAFETIYFWPGPEKSFQEVFRTLKPGGYFMIVNESDGKNERDQKWVDMIDGMQIFQADELCCQLKELGFSDVTIFHNHENHWICFLAEKP